MQGLSNASTSLCNETMLPEGCNCAVKETLKIFLTSLCRGQSGVHAISAYIVIYIQHHEFVCVRECVHVCVGPHVGGFPSADLNANVFAYMCTCDSVT